MAYLEATLFFPNSLLSHGSRAGHTTSKKPVGPTKQFFGVIGVTCIFFSYDGPLHDRGSCGMHLLQVVCVQTGSYFGSCPLLSPWNLQKCNQYTWRHNFKYWLRQLLCSVVVSDLWLRMIKIEAGRFCKAIQSNMVSWSPATGIVKHSWNLLSSDIF